LSICLEAFFGVACSLGLRRMYARDSKKTGGPTTSNYQSDLFAMIGTLFLFIFWPSFNGALARNFQQHRVIINTVLSISASAIGGFIASHAVFGKFDMVHIQNATLAGGVAVGSSADLVIQPFGSILVGSLAGVLSVLGYVYLSPFLAKRFNLQDTAGVNNLHALPGLLGGFVGAISSSTATSTVAYGQPIDVIFIGRGAPLFRTAGTQGWFQLAAVFVTLGIALTSGYLTGWILPLITKGPGRPYHDKEDWELPADVEKEKDDYSEDSKVEKMEHDDDSYSGLRLREHQAKAAQEQVEMIPA